MELEDIVNEEMLTTEDVNDMLEHTLSLIHISEPTRP